MACCVLRWDGGEADVDPTIELNLYVLSIKKRGSVGPRSSTTHFDSGCTVSNTGIDTPNDTSSQ